MYHASENCQYHYVITLYFLFSDLCTILQCHRIKYIGFLWMIIHCYFFLHRPTIVVTSLLIYHSLGKNLTHFSLTFWKKIKWSITFRVSCNVNHVTDIINCGVLNVAKTGDGRRPSSDCLRMSNDAKTCGRGQWANKMEWQVFIELELENTLV